MKYVLAIVWLTLVMLPAGCTTGPEPREVLNRSHDAMREVQSYQFSGMIETKTQDGAIGGRQSG